MTARKHSATSKGTSTSKSKNRRLTLTKKTLKDLGAKPKDPVGGVRVRTCTYEPSGCY